MKSADEKRMSILNFYNGSLQRGVFYLRDDTVAKRKII